MVAVSAAMVVVGGIAGWFVGARYAARQAVAAFIPLRSPEGGQYKFIDPLVGFDIAASRDFPELASTKQDIESFFQDEIRAKHLHQAGVYVRTLKNGHWFGINDEKEFSPGSLLKVPIMIAFFKKAELNPRTLQEKIQYHTEASPGAEPAYAVPSHLADGAWYTAEELISAMIIQSDNGAKNALLDAVDPEYLKEAFFDMGFASVDEASTVSPRAYANFFRRLYNATFLTRDFSERALAMLGKTEFSAGLRAGVPAPIAVAHKFGERGVYEDGRVVGVELHDCGIVYEPGNPYFICVMTSGYDEKSLARIIREVSARAYATLTR